MKHLLFILFLFSSYIAKAQSNIEESLHESGKINVVVGVILIIFIGIVFYLFRLDRKISKLEKEDND